MMFRKTLLTMVVCIVLALLAACGEATPITVIETVVVRETVEVEKEVEVIVTKEVEKEVEKVVTVEVEKEVVVVETVEVEKEVTVIETVEVIEVVTVEVTPEPATPTPEPTLDTTSPMVDEVLNRITYVQHHYDLETERDVFTCASRGEGLNAVEIDTQGPRFVGPNAGDFDLWGVVALFKISPDGSIMLVPQQTGGRFVDPEGIEHDSFTLEQALELFATGNALWLDDHGEAGRIGECDPQYVVPSPTPRS